MLDPAKMGRPLSDEDRAWLKWNNRSDLAEQFDREDGVLDGEQSEEDSEVDYSTYTVVQLKAEIERRNVEIAGENPDADPLSLEGKKDDLIETLKADDAALAAASDGAGDE